MCPHSHEAGGMDGELQNSHQVRYAEPWLQAEGAPGVTFAFPGLAGPLRQGVPEIVGVNWPVLELQCVQWPLSLKIRNLSYAIFN